MEFKFRSVDERPPPPPPCSAVTYFSPLHHHHAFAFPGGQAVAPVTSTVAAEISSQPNIISPPPPPSISVSWTPDMRFHPDPLQHQNLAREEIQRQLEKDMIREEILAAELSRRRILEAEVRRELMLEREFAMRRAAAAATDGLAFDPRLHRHLPFPFSFDDNRFPFFPSGTPAALDTFSFPPRPPEPLTNDFNNKNKLILLAKPDPNLSGVKRKTPPAVDASELPPFGLKKKPKEEWSCALCQVSVSCEKVLIEHINGRKHKNREAGLRAQNLAKSSRNARLSKKSAMVYKRKDTNVITSPKVEAKQVGESLCHNEGNDGLNKKMLDTGTSKEEKEEQPMWKDQRGEDLKKKNELKMVEGLERKEDVKEQNKFKFWCEECKIGAFNSKVMLAHMSGKKHARHQELTQHHVPIKSSMASSEAIKEAEDDDSAKGAQEKISLPWLPSYSDSQGIIVELMRMHNADLTQETKNTSETVADLPSYSNSQGLISELIRSHNADLTQETKNTSEIVADSDVSAASLMVNT